MTEWDDFDDDGPRVGSREPDEYQVLVREKLREHFEQNEAAVFFGGQLAVRHEDEFFHWITHRAIADLVGEGLVRSEKRTLAIGNEIKLLWHRRHRYYKRDAGRVVALVEEYGSPAICEALGWYGEHLVLAGFAGRQFIQKGRHTRKYRGRSEKGRWIGSRSGT